MNTRSPVDKEMNQLKYHFSEDCTIERFVPRPAMTLPNNPSVVWALDAERSVHYYFPRDCPRVIYTRSDSATPEDIARFFDGSAADKIIVVESGWLNRIRDVELYVYKFSDDHFTSIDGTAGYYVSTKEIVPLHVEPVGDLLLGIAQSGAELRFTPSLVPLRDAVKTSSLDFSVIRFRNAVKG